MGNSGSSHQQQVTLVEGSPPHSWAHSYPRTATSFKVLPDRVSDQRLRFTDNGAILNNGGTISGRNPYPNEPQHQQGCKSSSAFLNGTDFCRTLYGSEPDLRYRQAQQSKRPPFNVVPSHQTYYSNNNNDNSVKSRIGRTRKKYKAPTPAPHINSDDLTTKLRERAVREPPVGKSADNPHLSPVFRGQENCSEQQQRKSALNMPCQGDKPSSRRVHKGAVPYVDNKLLLRIGIAKNRPESVHYPDGYRLRSHRATTQSAIAKEIQKKEVHVKTSVESRCGAGTEKKATTKQNNESRVVEANKKTEIPAAPVKKFYFGMEADIHAESLINGKSNEVDKFAASLRQSTPIITSTSSPSESFSSEKNNDGRSVGISLKLRPTLPRKQIDIPRFSPTAAWRLLSALESPIHSEEDDMILMEERIPHHFMNHNQLTIHKSGDSGIWGDASPQNQDSAHISQIVAWTPQQDLEETSSDGGLESAPISPESNGTAKFSPRFSLSLPRDESLSMRICSDKHLRDIQPTPSFQSLNKLQRSVSGALSKNEDVAVSSLDENWLFSRSVPNLYNNSYIQRWSDTSPSSGEQDDDPSCLLSKPSSFSYLANGGHIMYLPKYKSTSHRERHAPQSTHLSLSCEDLTQRHQNEIRNHENGCGPKLSDLVNGLVGNSANKLKSSRKFTFQSTIRQIERRKIAEKLSTEAEEKEKRRLRELEVMKKVEKEFQRKREREKVDIRHQLTLYKLTEGSREHPDGAVAPSPPRGTQILSEFRQPRRDYRDYTPSRSDLDSISHSDPGIKRETIYPEVMYKIPKNAQIYVIPHHSSSGHGNSYQSLAESPRVLSSGNYRKDFAQGAPPRSVASSDSELSQPNTRSTSRTKQRSRF